MFEYDPDYDPWFEFGTRVRLVHGRYDGQLGTVHDGADPPHESIHGTLYDIVLDDGSMTVSDGRSLRLVSIVEELAALVRP